MTVNLFCGPAFKMSYTGLQFKNVSLHFKNGSLVEQVFLARNKPKIARLITFVDVDPIQLKSRRIPAVQGDNVTKERAPVFSPIFIDVNAAFAVMLVPAVFWVVATVDTCGYSTEQPAAMRIIGNNVSVSVIIFTPETRLFFSAHIAPCRPTFSKVVIRDQMRFCATRTLNPNHWGNADTVFNAFNPNNGKLAEPVASIWERMFASKCTVFAAYHFSAASN